MSRYILPLIIFFFFIMESVFVDLLGAQVFGAERIFVPRFVLILLIMIGIYYDRQHAVYEGVIFGFLFDVFYTEVLGIHMFMYGVIAYLMGYAKRMLHANLFIVLLLGILSTALLEVFNYSVYTLIGSANMSWEVFTNIRLLPTLLLNSVFTIIAFYPLRRLLEQLYKKRKEAL
ncbi:rod shape-determining protein MreD [Bacillus tianshenii]|nr:rod shape-determining protein MreD [Bacillus tianshenii]